MSPDILCNVRENLEKASILNNKQLDKLLSNMKWWKLNKLIYPSFVKSLIYSSYENTYEVLEILKQMGLLEHNYELYCSKCEKFIDTKVLKSLNDFPKDFYCDENHKLNPFDDAILIYRVIKVGKE